MNSERELTLKCEFYLYIARFQVRCFSFGLICWLKFVCPFYVSKIFLDNWWKWCIFYSQIFFHAFILFCTQIFADTYYQTFVEVLARAVFCILCSTKVYLHKPQHNNLVKDGGRSRNERYFVYKWFSWKHCLPVVLFKDIYHHK